MTDTSLFSFFKGIIDSDNGPIVVCDLDYKIIYVNPFAVSYYKSGPQLLNKRLDVFLDEERMSMVYMSVEWFKEDEKNNKVFVFHDERSNMDMYVFAVRDENNQLIGFFNKQECRTPDTGKILDLD